MKRGLQHWCYPAVCNQLCPKRNVRQLNATLDLSLYLMFDIRKYWHLQWDIVMSPRLQAIHIQLPELIKNIWKLLVDSLTESVEKRINYIKGFLYKLYSKLLRFYNFFTLPWCITESKQCWQDKDPPKIIPATYKHK